MLQEARPLNLVHKLPDIQSGSPTLALNPSDEVVRAIQKEAPNLVKTTKDLINPLAKFTSRLDGQKSSPSWLKSNRYQTGGCSYNIPNGTYDRNIQTGNIITPNGEFPEGDLEADGYSVVTKKGNKSKEELVCMNRLMQAPAPTEAVILPSNPDSAYPAAYPNPIQSVLYDNSGQENNQVLKTEKDTELLKEVVDWAKSDYNPILLPIGVAALSLLGIGKLSEIKQKRKLKKVPYEESGTANRNQFKDFRETLINSHISGETALVYKIQALTAKGYAVVEVGGEKLIVPARSAKHIGKTNDRGLTFIPYDGLHESNVIRLAADIEQAKCGRNDAARGQVVTKMPMDSPLYDYEIKNHFDFIFEEGGLDPQARNMDAHGGEILIGKPSGHAPDSVKQLYDELISNKNEASIKHL